MRRLRLFFRRLRFRTSRWALWIGLAVLLYIAAALFLPPLVADYDGATGDGRAQSVASARQGLLLLGGGILAGLTLLFTWRRDTLTRDANFTDRYTEAIAQLGNDSVAIRLGGVYALERIARDSKRDRQTILDVLAAYLRVNARRSPNTVDDPTKSNETAVDLSAAALVLARITRLSAPGQRLDLSLVHVGNVDLTAANFSGANLVGVSLPASTLTGADLTRATLQSAELSGAKLDGATLAVADLRFAQLSHASALYADLRGADLSDAVVNNVDLIGCNASRTIFWRTQLIEADFNDANLQGARFSRANLSGANLSNADLTDASLIGTNLTNVDLTQANLARANLSGAVLLGADLTDAILTDAILPEGFGGPPGLRDM